MPATRQNLFIAQTPFQLFNCCEAAKRFHPDDENRLLIIDRGHARNNAQIQVILNNETFSEVIRVPFFRLSDKLFYGLRLRSLLQRLGPVDTLYVALFRNIAAHIINTLKPAQLVIYDDGNRILRVANDLFQGDLIKRNRLKNLAGKLAGKQLSLAFARQATFFSVFNLTAQGVEHWQHNDYRAFRQRGQMCQKRQAVALIGSRLIDTTLSQVDFEAAVQQVVNHYKQQGRHLEYIPHRYEDLDYLQQLADQLGFTLTPLDTILEYHYLAVGSYPATVATFRSTAVSSLAQLFDIDTMVFQLPENSILPAQRPELALVYQNFAKQGYSIQCLT